MSIVVVLVGILLGAFMLIIESYYVLWLLERVYYYYFGLFLIESWIQGWRKDEEKLAG